MSDLPLAGYSIAITRPAAQAQSLAALVRAQGGNPVLFPLLEIMPLEDCTACERAIDHLHHCDWAIFISTNAVKYGIPYVLKRGGWPDYVQCAGIGPTTATALANFGIAKVLAPTHRFDSEGLLALPEMQAVTGKRIIIFRGVGGRDLIASALRARGAEVLFAECYRRINPQIDAGDLLRLWQNSQLQAIVITSSEVLRNLVELAGGKAHLADWLCATPLCVSHPRIGELAFNYGLKSYTANGPDDEAMLQCLLHQARPAKREQIHERQ